MRVPSADELAAIAAAYLVATRVAAPAPPPRSRWALAGRLPELELERARTVADARSPWTAATRTDD